MPQVAWSSVAEGWREWWHVFEAAASELNRSLVDAAGVAEGHRVLFVGDRVEGYTVTVIRKDDVTLMLDEDEVVVSLP